MHLQGKRVLVVGAARSGVAAARFLAQKGAFPVLTDNKPGEEFGGELDYLKRLGVELVLGTCPEIDPGKFDLAVVSPGVPPEAPPVARSQEAGIPVTGELELAWRFARAPVVAITGTNGKTTTTVLAGEIFKQAGYNTHVAGNIGTPFIDVVEKSSPGDVIVLEVSSFQLETVDSFRPRVGAVLNLTPDHLDRHGTMEEYTRAKARIFSCQGKKDKTVLNFDDSRVKELAEQAPGEVIFFSRRHNLVKGVFVESGMISAGLGDGRVSRIMPAAEVAIPGAHNLENSLAAAACGLAMGVDTGVLVRTLQKFPGVPHRLEPVGEIDGVSYVNDSKGTNPEASIKALEAFDKPIVLIAGGRNKGSDFSGLAGKIKEKARAVVVIGECARELESAIKGAGETRVLKAGSLPEAVSRAREEAQPGDIVLMSPACASWDMFNDYEARGDLFRETVQNLGG